MFAGRRCFLQTRLHFWLYAIVLSGHFYESILYLNRLVYGVVYVSQWPLSMPESPPLLQGGSIRGKLSGKILQDFLLMSSVASS